MQISAGAEWRAHLIRVGSRSALVCASDSTERSEPEFTLLESLMRELIAHAGQRSDVSVRAIKVSSKQPAAEGLAAELSADYTARLDAQADAERLIVALVVTPVSRELPAHQKRFEAPVSDRIRFLDETAGHVLADILTLLDDRALQGMREWGTKNLDAYRHASVAEPLHANFDLASLEKAAKHYRCALALDPVFESVYLELAEALDRTAGLVTSDAARAQLRLELQDLLSDARLNGIREEALEGIDQTNAFLLETSPLELEAAKRRDLVAGSMSPDVWGGYAQVLCGAGLLDESARYLEVAIRLEPRAAKQSWVMERSVIAGARGDFAEHAQLLKNNLEIHPNSTLDLSGLIRSLARLGRYAEAETHLAHLKATDPGWAFGARLALSLIRGDLTVGSETFEKIVGNPASMNINRGIACLMVGDVERGVRFWREIEPTFAPLLWRFTPQFEHVWAPSVFADARYQDMLNDLGIGWRWKRHVWDRAKELRAVTEIPVTSPRPGPRPTGVRARASALELMPYGFIGLDEHGRISFTNSVAERILSARRGLKTVGVQLAAEDADASIALRAAIERALASGESAAELAPVLVRCPRRPPARVLQLFVTPAQGDGAAWLDAAGPRVRVIVIVSDPDDTSVPDASALELLFDLTPTLARLAVAIAGGKTVKEYAEDHEVSEGTARGQLKELVARVGVRRQAELVGVLLSGVAQLRVGRH